MNAINGLFDFEKKKAIMLKLTFSDEGRLLSMYLVK